MPQAAFEVQIDDVGAGRLFRIFGRNPAGAELTRSYGVAAISQNDYSDFFVQIAANFGTRLPHNRAAPPPPRPDLPCQPLLTANLCEAIAYGYGDPAVIRCDGEEPCYYLVVTSNDAPDAFPIIRSTDLQHWEHIGFVFPEGAKPAWAAHGRDVSDFWAPELHAYRGGFLLCFSARAKDGSLAIGIARSDRPEGPFVTPDEPLLRGGVIDAHIFVEQDRALLFWKDDSNGVWPMLLAELLHGDEALADHLFARTEDRRTAALAAALAPWLRTVGAMERFFVLQPLIESAVEDFTGIREKLAGLGSSDAAAVLEAMRTPIHAQMLSPDGLSLVGDASIVLANDLDWEGHLIEGPWVTHQQGLYYLFYAGNDFSTARYGIGVAIAESPLGPYRKMPEPLLRSTVSWSGPGHPSVALGPDGEPWLFFHAFFPGTGGYKEFRALLMARLAFHPDRVELLD